MNDRRYRVLLVASHVVQYATPVFREMARHPKLDVQVAYCSLHGAKRGFDQELGVEVAWDLPLLDGYPWVEIRNRSPWPGPGRLFGLVNPGLWKLVRTGGYDAVLSYTGYAYLSFWILALAAKFSRIPLIASTDAHSLRSPNSRWWKLLLKRCCLPLLYRLFDVVLAPSEANVRFVKSLGIPEERVLFAPGGFDNEWWARKAREADRVATRSRWGIPEGTVVFLFCGKLQPWKRPQDLLHALARLGICDAFVVYAGDGPLRAELEAEARALGISKRAVFLGFVNQTVLPELYRAADVLVLSSGYDGCPLVVCEAMSSGCPVVLSDAVPGRFELVRQGDTGFIYPCGNVDALASIFREVLENPERLKGLSSSAAERMKAWSLGAYADGLALALARIVPVRAGLTREQEA